MDSSNFMLGINYWPSKKAMYWWKNWDRAEVEEDFAKIRENGFDKVRFFLLCEDFQPEPYKISIESVNNLVKTLDIAHENGLGIMPTFFTGHMSGLNWMPNWMLESNTGDVRFPVYSQGKLSKRLLINYFSRQEIIRSQVYQLSEIAKVLKGHPALWGWDLGNEPSNCAIPACKGQGNDWLGVMVEALKTVDEKIPVTIGMHMEDLEEDRNMGPVEAGKYCDFICMHGYPIYTKWADGPTDPNLLPFLAAITGWLGKKPVLFQEFGLATSEKAEESNGMLVTEEEAADYYSKVLDGLYKVGCTGAFAWCYADYDPQIWHQPPLDTVLHERNFGLWKYDGQKKKVLDSIKKFEKKTVLKMDYNPTWIDIEPEEFYNDPSVNLKMLYNKYNKCNNMEN